ncbi:MAG TPA: PilN domain-containing protein, partial [Gammaproteobacteria bacterium]|nr:PilN domain-containing protein [Gammaproteobacteria bacterium]
VVGYWNHAMSASIDYQNQRNNFLKTQISRVDKRIADIKDMQKTRKELLARMRIIEQLQQSRPQVVHLFDQLVRTLPDGIYLSSVAQTGDSLKLDGVAQSSARISTYMRNIAESDWLADPNLTVIKANGDSKLHRKQFSLTAQVTGPAKGKE